MAKTEMRKQKMSQVWMLALLTLAGSAVLGAQTLQGRRRIAETNFFTAFNAPVASEETTSWSTPTEILPSTRASARHIRLINEVNQVNQGSAGWGTLISSYETMLALCIRRQSETQKTPRNKDTKSACRKVLSKPDATVGRSHRSSVSLAEPLRRNGNYQRAGGTDGPKTVRIPVSEMRPAVSARRLESGYRLGEVERVPITSFENSLHYYHEDDSEEEEDKWHKADDVQWSPMDRKEDVTTSSPETERLFSQTVRTLLLGTATPPAEKTISKIITFSSETGPPGLAPIVVHSEGINGGYLHAGTITKVPSLLRAPHLRSTSARPPVGPPSYPLPPPVVVSSTGPKKNTKVPAERPAGPLPALDPLTVDHIASAIAHLLYPALSGIQQQSAEVPLLGDSHPDDAYYQLKLQNLRDQLAKGTTTETPGVPGRVPVKVPSIPSFFPPVSRVPLVTTTTSSTSTTTTPRPTTTTTTSTTTSTTSTIPAPVTPTTMDLDQGPFSDPQSPVTPRPSLSTSPLIHYLLTTLNTTSTTPIPLDSSTKFSQNLTAFFAQQQGSNGPMVHSQADPLVPLYPTVQITIKAGQVTTIGPLSETSTFDFSSEEEEEDAPPPPSTTTEASSSPPTTTTTTTKAPVVLVASETVQTPAVQILAELEQSNIMQGPMSVINGTRIGFMEFITTLGTLSFTTKLIMVLALSLAVFSILFGVYSMWPPVVAVGILGILIPIGLLLLLQDPKSRTKTIITTQQKQNPKGKITAEQISEGLLMAFTLVEEALQKYQSLNDGFPTDGFLEPRDK